MLYFQQLKSRVNMQVAVNESQIENEYRIWRKNAPCLYNVLYTQHLSSPSLTAQWLPSRESFKQDGYTNNKLLYGTNSPTDQPNHLIIAVVKIPCQVPPSPSSTPTIGLTQQLKQDKIKTFAMIAHQGPVLRARCNPFKENQIATKSEDGVVHVYDYFDHTREGKERSGNTMHLRLKGLEGMGFGLAWNQKKEGVVVAGDNGGRVMMWDVNRLEERKAEVNYKQSFGFHQSSVGDVAVHKFHGDYFMSGDDDGQLAIWDIKQPSDQPIFKNKISQGQIYSLDWSPKNEYILAAGGSDKLISVWDIRNMQQCLFKLQGHTDDVTKVQWSPTDQSLLWSGGADRRINIWDLSEPKVKFVHAGHRSTVSDFDVSATEVDTVCAVEEEQVIQVYQPFPGYLQ